MRKSNGRFKKGIAPWNKGFKGLHFSLETEFKKGDTPINWLPVGTISIRLHHGDKGRVRKWIKIKEPNKWMEHTVYIWKKKYGKIIKGDVISHLNGISYDDRIENLVAMPKADLPSFFSRWGLNKLTDKQLKFYKSRYKINNLSKNTG